MGEDDAVAAARAECQRIWEQQAQAKVGSYAVVDAALDVLVAAVRLNEHERECMYCPDRVCMRAQRLRSEVVRQRMEAAR